jgi:hypothetical protein
MVNVMLARVAAFLRLRRADFRSMVHHCQSAKPNRFYLTAFNMEKSHMRGSMPPFRCDGTITVAADKQHEAAEGAIISP